jgi:hypothetical protein
MANILFITIGTRDVQINPGIEKHPDVNSLINHATRPEKGNLILVSARADGKKILNNWEKCSPFLELPMIYPTVRWILDIYDTIDLVYLITTDQEKAKVNVEPRHLGLDTIHFAEIIKNYLSARFPKQIGKIKTIIITDNIVFSDLIYEKFRTDIKEDSALKKLNKSDISAFVFTQGGIAGINNALLIAVTELFPKVNHLTKPEGFAEPINSKFPYLFRQNIMTEKIKYAIENFEYGVLSNFNYSNLCNCLGDYAYHRLHFDFRQARKSLARYEDGEERYFIANCVNDTRLIEEDMGNKNKEWYITCKIKLQQKNYSDFLLRIFNLSENILKPQVQNILGGTFKFSSRDNHKEWNNLIVAAGLESHLNSVIQDGSQLKFNYPNRYAYKAIFDHMADAAEVKKYNELIEPGLSKLVVLRNSAGHNLDGVSINDIEEELQKVGLTIAGFIDNLDAYFDVTGFEHFDKINAVLLKHLS